MTLYQLEDKQPKLLDKDSCWIAPGAHVIGDVTLGPNVGIWFSAILRGDNEPITIGGGTNVQEGVIIHTDSDFPVDIGDGCTIGHHAIVHGCKIGENSLVGMGATILNGAKIGKNCLVGANALVTEGKVFPDGSLIVGSPASALRLLDHSVIDDMRANSEKYVANKERFQKGLKTFGLTG